MSRQLEPSAGAELLVQLDDLLERAAPGGHAHAELTLAYAAVEEAIELYRQDGKALPPPTSGRDLVNHLQDAG